MKATIHQSTLEVVQGDITQQETEAIGNAANSALAGGGGVDGAIHRAGGATIMSELKAKYKGCPTGSAVITGGGNLKARYVIHAVGPRYSGSARDAELLSRAVLRAPRPGRDQQESLAEYQRVRDSLAWPMLDVTERLASYDWDLAEVRGLLLRLSSVMADELEVLAALDAAA